MTRYLPVDSSLITHNIELEVSGSSQVNHQVRLFSENEFIRNTYQMKDIYHSYLALATLAMMKEKGLKELDPVLCVSANLKYKIHNASLEYWA